MTILSVDNIEEKYKGEINYLELLEDFMELLEKKGMEFVVDLECRYKPSIIHLFNEYISDYPNPKLSKYPSFASFYKRVIENEDDNYKKYILVLNVSYNLILHIKDTFHLRDIYVTEDTDLDTNIEGLLAPLNLKVADKTVNNIFPFILIDEDVASIVDEIKDDNLQNDIWAYLDSEILNDIERKRDILYRLGFSLEPIRHNLEKINKSLTDKVFMFLNKFSIRHNTDKQVNFESEEEQIKYYDMGFKLIIHLLREDTIKSYFDEIIEKCNYSR